MSWIGAINIFILQWFFVRLTKSHQFEVTKMEITEVSLMPDGSTEIGGLVQNKRTMCWYSLQLWIIPLTGWWNEFKYLSKEPIFIKLTKPIQIS